MMVDCKIDPASATVVPENLSGIDIGRKDDIVTGDISKLITVHRPSKDHARRSDGRVSAISEISTLRDTPLCKTRWYKWMRHRAMEDLYNSVCYILFETHYSS